VPLHDLARTCTSIYLCDLCTFQSVVKGERVVVNERTQKT
jgi:hypothetical protein